MELTLGDLGMLREETRRDVPIVVIFHQMSLYTKLFRKVRAESLFAWKTGFSFRRLWSPSAANPGELCGCVVSRES